MTRRKLGICGGLAVALACLFPRETAAREPGPFTKGPYVQALSATAAEVRIEVDPPAPVSLDFGDAGAGGRLEQTQATAFHVFPLTDLSPRTTYRFLAQVGAHAGGTGGGSAPLLADGASTKGGTFTTAPPDDTTDPVRFLVYGDNRTDDSAHASVVRAMLAHPADFLVHTGDYVENGGSAKMWQTFFDIEASLVASSCLFGTIGNHELVDKEATYFLRYFGPLSLLTDAGVIVPPVLHRTFRWGFLRFFVLSGMGDVAEERTWLDAELAKSDHEAGISFRIAVTHHGPWSSGPHGRNAKLHQTGIVDALRKHHVNVVLSGHDHIYERGDAEGMPYVVTGGGGAPPYEQQDKLVWTRMFEASRHFVEVRATPALLSFSAIRTDGSVIDTCGISRDKPGWDCDGSRKQGDSRARENDHGASSAPKTSSDGDHAKSACACSHAIGARDASGRHAANGELWDVRSDGRAEGRSAAIFGAVFGLFLLGRRRYARGRCESPSSSR